MICEYIQAAMAKAVFTTTEDPEPVFGEIPACQGVWATGNTVEESRQTLEEVLEGWILLGVRLGHSLPEIEGARIEVPEISSLR